MAAIVLVHGAFQGGWVWHEVAARLRIAGHVVHAPTLTGCGYLSNGGLTGDCLDRYVTDIANYLVMEDLEEVILVAHSFSGLICAGVMMRQFTRIKEAVFVDAVIAEPGRSFAELAGAPFHHMLENHRLDQIRVAPWPLKVFGVEDSDRASWFTSRLRPFPYQAFHDRPADVFDPHAIANTYVSCRQTTSGFIRTMAATARRLNWAVHELDTGHCPMVTKPVDLTRLLLAAGAHAECRISA